MVQSESLAFTIVSLLWISLIFPLFKSLYIYFPIIISTRAFLDQNPDLADRATVIFQLKNQWTGMQRPVMSHKRQARYVLTSSLTWQMFASSKARQSRSWSIAMNVPVTSQRASGRHRSWSVASSGISATSRAPRPARGTWRWRQVRYALSSQTVSYPKDMYVRRYAELVSELAYEY